MTEPVEKCFKHLNRFCTVLEKTLDIDDYLLDIPKETGMSLCHQLADNHYTYLTLSTPYLGLECREIIKVCQRGGHLLVEERGIDYTEKQRWPCGSPIEFEINKPVLQALLSEVKEENKEEDCPEETYTGDIKNGNCTLKVKDGVVVKSVPNKHQIPDGQYKNSDVCMEDGCIISIGDGDGIAKRATHVVHKKDSDGKDKFQW